MPVINNTNVPNATIDALVVLPQITAGASGRDEEVDFVVDDGVNMWRLSTVTAGDDLIVNEAYHVEKTGEMNAIQSYTPL